MFLIYLNFFFFTAPPQFPSPCLTLNAWTSKMFHLPTLEVSEMQHTSLCFVSLLENQVDWRIQETRCWVIYLIWFSEFEFGVLELCHFSAGTGSRDIIRRIWKQPVIHILQRNAANLPKVLIRLLEVCQELNKCGNCPVKWDLRDEVNYMTMKWKASVSLIVSLRIVICSILTAGSGRLHPDSSEERESKWQRKRFTWMLVQITISITTVTSNSFAPLLLNPNRKSLIDFFFFWRGRRDLQVRDTL